MAVCCTGLTVDRRWQTNSHRPDTHLQQITDTSSIGRACRQTTPDFPRSHEGLNPQLPRPCFLTHSQTKFSTDGRACICSRCCRPKALETLISFALLTEGPAPAAAAGHVNPAPVQTPIVLTQARNSSLIIRCSASEAPTPPKLRCTKEVLRPCCGREWARAPPPLQRFLVSK